MMYDFFCNGYGFGNSFWLMSVFWILLLAVVIGLVVWLVIRASRPQVAKDTALSANTGVRALDILKERYARGEITREEFESMRKDILE